MRRLRESELARRQQHLLLRSAALRVTLGQQVRVLQTPLALADQDRAGLQWLRAHPLWPIGALLLIALKRPRRALRWASRVGIGWNLYKKAREWLFKTNASAPRASQTAASGPTDPP